MQPEQPKATTPLLSKRKLRTAGLVGAGCAALVVAAGLVSRANGNSELRAWTNAQIVSTVSVVSPGRADNAAGFELPGRLEAYSRAPIYARVSGYLKTWNVDIGMQVKAGQQLAEIETPDLDQQLLQARADLATAQANANLAASTAKRWQALLGSDSVSKQEVDEKNGDLAAKQAVMAAAKANLDRNLALKAFTRIVSPFNGIVTARNTDVGALIAAGNGMGQELFVLSDVHKLRVYVSVPQNYVSSVPPGTKGLISVPEHPGKTYPAVVEASSRAVSAATGTTLMQLVVDNAAGELMPGGYANVKLALPPSAAAASVPASALIFNAQGLAVAVIGADGKVVLKPVTVKRDLGQVIEVDGGLAAGDRVIENPPDGVAAGATVRIAEEGKNAKR
ncbi:MAG: efflux RND transporter periplasmic adaptor subunit [Candidatus Protistobacter heckmanni]|nr:efflux RND transporter periplasmic adaptor subunit [Candidatus Protistobacter heckmanni]